MNKITLNYLECIADLSLYRRTTKQDPDALPNGIMQPVEGTERLPVVALCRKLKEFNAKSNEINLMLKEE